MVAIDWEEVLDFFDGLPTAELQRYVDTSNGVKLVWELYVSNERSMGWSLVSTLINIMLNK